MISSTPVFSCQVLFESVIGSQLFINYARLVIQVDWCPVVNSRVLLEIDRGGGINQTKGES